jgi:O-antigen ligase
MNLVFLRSATGQTILSTILAAILLLPALALHQFNLAVAAVLVCSLAFLLFSHPLYALIAYVMLIPLEELAVFSALGTPTRLAGILFFATYLFHRRFQINLKVMPVAAWLWLVWVTASLIWSPILKWDFYFQTVQLFIATLLIADYVSRFPEKIGTIVNGYTISSAVIACFGIYNFFTFAGSSDRLSFESRVSGIEGQGVETFAFSLIPALLTAFHRIIHSTHRKWLWLNVTLVLLFSLGIILSGTRGAWVATAGTILIVYLPRLKLRQYLMLATIALLGTYIALRMPLVADFIQFRSQDTISSGGAGRIGIWKVSWQMVQNNPLIGIGWRMAEYQMTFQDFERVRSNIIWDFDSGRFKPRVTHNIYLQTLLELGIVGLVLFLAWILPLLLTREDAFYVQVLALAIFIAMLIGGITNPEFHKKYYWLALGLVQGCYYFLKQQKVITGPHENHANTPYTKLR